MKLFPHRSFERALKYKHDNTTNIDWHKPLFCNGDGTGITDKELLDELHYALKASKLSCLGIGTRAFRRGGAQELERNGANGDQIKLEELLKDIEIEYLNGNEFLINYTNKEQVELFIVGQPKQMNNSDSESEKHILSFLKQLEKSLPKIPIKRIDERFTSKIAFQTMIDSGLKKKQRRNKGLVDEISATIILQSYLYSK